tara:strand:+ start:1502 stop:1729 length:228 start_codon:yes stop_codon:yes gene_type:complete
MPDFFEFFRRNVKPKNKPVVETRITNNGKIVSCGGRTKMLCEKINITKNIPIKNGWITIFSLLILDNNKHLSNEN